MARPVLHPAALQYVGPEIARDDSEVRLILAIHRHGLARSRHWLDRDFKGLSQAGAIALTGLSQASVSTLAKGLRERGLLLKDADGLVLDPAAGIAFGIDIGFRQVRAAVSDLHGQLRPDGATPHGIRERRSTPLGMDAAKALDWMEQELRSLEEGARADGAKDAKIMGVGVSLAGPVDSETGKLRRAWETGGDWQFLSATAELEQRLKWKTDFIADRDANASAAAEAIWGVAGSTPDVLYCKWAEGGVSAALTFNHQIFHGGAGIAGEITHAIVPIDKAHTKDESDECLEGWFEGRKECEHCGRKRCLWAVTSLECLQTYVGAPDLDAARLIELANAYEPDKHGKDSREYEARHAFKAAARCLGRVLTPLIDAFNPTKVILGGKIGVHAFPMISSALNAGIAEQGVTPAIRAAELSRGTIELTGETSVRGAIAHALIQAAPYRLYALARERDARKSRAPRAA